MKKNVFLFTLGFYGWLVVIIILTSMSFKEGSEKFSDSHFRWDYIHHFFMFFFIPLLYWMSNGAGLIKIIKNQSILIFLGLTFAMITEVYQLWITGRSFNPIDLILNLSGFLLGILLVVIIKKKNLN